MLSPNLAAQFGVNRFLLLAGFSGSPLEIGYQAEKVHDLTGARGEILDDDRAHQAYEKLRDFDLSFAPLTAQIAVPPALLPPTLDACKCEFRAHAGSGVAQILLLDTLTADVSRNVVARWRESVHAARGVLRIVAASPDLRQRLEIFDTPNAGALAIMRRLKSAFDPAGIFNPGCFVGGI